MNSLEQIVIIGYGWVGQANALALAEMGYSVGFFDTADSIKYHYESENDHYDQIQRVQHLDDVDSPNTYYIVCVGDKVSEDRVQDISLIKKATDQLKGKNGKVILRSTVLPQKLSELYFDLYVPEFLHELKAVEECIHPYYFVLGVRNDITIPNFLKEWEKRAYKTFKGTPEEASYVKYLSNIWNSIRVAFVNEMGDSMLKSTSKEEVRRVERVLDFILEKQSYLSYGQAFDGHCLPKDTRAYIGAHAGDNKNVDLLIGAYASNEAHKEIQEQITLPKIYSFWNYTYTGKNIFAKTWHAINSLSFVVRLRKNLRFVVDWLHAVIPDRSVRKTKKIWEKKAKQNALFFANTRTPSGGNVDEKEIKETGLRDYAQYIENDEYIEKHLNNTPKPIVLDFGSGVGRLTQYLADDGREVHGLDISETMVETARTLVKEKNITFQSYDGTNLPYEDNMFDLIFSHLVFQHVASKKDIAGYLSEFNRILKSDGIIKIQLRTGRGVKKWKWSYGASFTPEEAYNLAEQSGFKVLDQTVEGGKNLWIVLQKQHEN